MATGSRRQFTIENRKQKSGARAPLFCFKKMRVDRRGLGLTAT